MYYPFLNQIVLFAPDLTTLGTFGIIFTCFFALSMLGILIFLMPANGTRCPRCAEQGVETIVLHGKHCPKCGQPC